MPVHPLPNRRTILAGLAATGLSGTFAAAEPVQFGLDPQMFALDPANFALDPVKLAARALALNASKGAGDPQAAAITFVGDSYANIEVSYVFDTEQWQSVLGPLMTKAAQGTYPSRSFKVQRLPPVEIGVETLSSKDRVDAIFGPVVREAGGNGVILLVFAARGTASSQGVLLVPN